MSDFEAVAGPRSAENNDDDEIEPLADGAGAGARDLIAGKIVRGEYVLVLLDLQKILDRPELVVDQKERSEGGR